MSVVSDRSSISLPHQPGILLIHLLNHCNLSCQHCYMDAGRHGNTCLDPEVVIRCLLETERLNIGAVNLSGGEPFLYPELPEILSTASQMKDLQLFISTNGTLINETHLAILKKSGATIQVSIDGPETYHDQFRGLKNAFSLASRGISQLVDANIPVSIVSTICQDNIMFLPWLAEWAVEKNVDRIIVQPLWQLGRGAAIRNRKMTEQQIGSLFLQLSDMAIAYKSRGLNFSLVYYNRYFLLEHPCAAYACNGNKCHRKIIKEIRRLVIREDGTVLPEIATLDRRFSLGNLKEGTLEELVIRYFNNGYAGFDRLCRTVYKEAVQIQTSPIVPWEEIVSERSYTFNLSQELAIEQ